MLIAPHLLIDDFLSATERAELLDWALQNQARFRAAGVVGRIEPRARVALSLRDLGPLAERFRARARDSAAGWMAALKVTTFEPSSIELELVAHEDGARFTTHTDTYRSDQPAQGDRLLSAIYYLYREPKAFSGGDLRLHRLGAQAGDAGLDLAPAQGRLIVFPSWWPHEVLPISCPSGDFADSRFSVNCWIHRARPA